MVFAKGEKRALGQLPKVLVIDDEADIRELVDLTLSRMGLAAHCVGTVREGVTVLASERFDLCLTDMRLPDGDGLEVVRYIEVHCPQTPVAVITAFGSTDNAIAALKAGAFDYLAKPIGLDALRSLVRAALPLGGGGGAGSANSDETLIGGSDEMGRVRDLIGKLSRTQAPVFVSGESGTGKELAARLIHCRGPRATAPFVPVNCGAIPENLVESEFFGYRKGAFTGAAEDREGFFHAANGGTLFLDEVADLPMGMQVKLLRAVQERKVRKVGSTVEESVDVRIISATHQDLKARMEAGAFRQDLYYRLNVIELKMPALRERPEDIPELVAAILKRSVVKMEVQPKAMECLASYDFPGNVRELENIIERALALGDGVIEVADLQLSPPEKAAERVFDAQPGEDLQTMLDRIERQAIIETLGQTRGNRTAAARRLGVSFRSLRYRIERLDIDVGST